MVREKIATENVGMISNRHWFLCLEKSKELVLVFAIYMHLVEDVKIAGRLEAIARPYELEAAEDLLRIPIFLVSKLVARKGQDGELVTVFGSKLIHLCVVPRGCAS